MNLRPLGDHVVVRREPVAETSEGGIALPKPKVAHKGLEWGTVMEVGPGKDAPPLRSIGYTKLAVKRGDKVLFRAKKAYPITTDDGSDLVVMTEDDIEAIGEK
jgi:chaperonin GroES